MSTKIKRVAHVVLFVRDPESSAMWYSRVLGMQVSARAADGPYVGGIFMTFGERDHDLALFPRPDGATTGKEFEHIGLELESGEIDELRRLYGKFIKNEVKIAEILDHGVSIGIYFYDPDGHMLEVFVQQTPLGLHGIERFRADEGKADPIQLVPLFD